MVKYNINLLEGSFDGAAHDVFLEFEGNEVEINSGYRSENHATLTLEQFDAVAAEVARYREMVKIEKGEGS